MSDGDKLDLRREMANRVEASLREIRDDNPVAAQLAA
jgi:hypothetical protein